MNKVFFAQNVTSKILTNGYLYNWYAASNANFAPTDWSVPTDSQLDTLITYLGGSSVAGGKIKKTELRYWNTPNTGATNSSGFSAIGSGYRSYGGSCTRLLKEFYIHTKTEINSAAAYFHSAYYDQAYTYNGASNKPSGFSIRLLYTGSGTPGSTITDYDGNTYDVIQIGSQYWTVQNWKCTKLNNGTSIPNVTDATDWAALTTLGRCAYNNDEANV